MAFFLLPVAHQRLLQINPQPTPPKLLPMQRRRILIPLLLYRLSLSRVIFCPSGCALRLTANHLAQGYLDGVYFGLRLVTHTKHSKWLVFPHNIPWAEITHTVKWLLLLPHVKLPLPRRQTLLLNTLLPRPPMLLNHLRLINRVEKAGPRIAGRHS